MLIVPGYLIKVQVPVAGNPLSTTLPVDNVHVGGVIAPTAGAAGIGGWAMITTLPEAGETQPA